LLDKRHRVRYLSCGCIIRRVITLTPFNAWFVEVSLTTEDTGCLARYSVNQEYGNN